LADQLRGWVSNASHNIGMRGNIWSFNRFCRTSWAKAMCAKRRYRIGLPKPSQQAL
jgi:hypothetical protein